MPAKKSTGTKSQLPSLVGLLVGILIIPISVYLAQHVQIWTQKAFDNGSTTYPVTVGMTYTHTSFAGCNTPTGGDSAGYNNTGIIFTYNQPGVRDNVKQELARMKSSGIQSTGLVIWHMHDFNDTATWGVISSANKRIDEPYRTNFITYLQDVKDAGFTRMLITMGPQWRNAPSGHEGAGKYDPTLFEENWQFIRDVRSLVKQYGPKDAYFDLLGEGAPPNPDEIRKQQMWEYDKKLWTNYVSEFGKEDAIISFIAPNPVKPTDKDLWDSGAIDNLYTIFESSGQGQPNWYQFSFYPSQQTPERSLQILNFIDQKLTAKGYKGNLIIREGWYNNPGEAKAIAQFNATHSRKVIEVLSWFVSFYEGLGDPAIDKQHCPVSPPYSQNEFINNLPQRTVTINASPNPCDVTSSGLCTTNISWSVTNPKDIVQLKVRQGSEVGRLFAQGTSGAQDAPWISVMPLYMDVYDGTSLLTTLTIKGRGHITAYPNPCVLSAQGTCTSHISWNFGNASDTRITIKENPGSLFARGPVGAQDAPWITALGATFEVYSGDMLLDSIVVKGTKPQ